MKRLILLLLLTSSLLRAELPVDEAGAIAWFERAGARISRNEEGHAVKLFSGGNPPHSSEELQIIGKLVHLEQIALNNPQALNEEWGFLRELPRLRSLTIWHCKTIRSLEPFSGLPIESLTVGGCMGLRDLNRDTPEKQRDAVLTLASLPNLRSVNLYHSPTLSSDGHLLHLATEFPLLEEVKIDLAAPRGFEVSVTPGGFAHFQKLPVTVFSIENGGMLTAAHIEAIARIPTLETLLLDCRKKPFDTDPLIAEMKKWRPEVEVVVAGEGDSGPPRRSRKG